MLILRILQVGMQLLKLPIRHQVRIVSDGLLEGVTAGLQR